MRSGQLGDSLVIMDSDLRVTESEGGCSGTPSCWPSWTDLSRLLASSRRDSRCSISFSMAASGLTACSWVDMGSHGDECGEG